MEMLGAPAVLLSVALSLAQATPVTQPAAPSGQRGTETRAADGDLFVRLATCKDSWLDWKDDPARSRQLAGTFNAAFTRKPSGAGWAPRARLRVLGLPVLEAFPDSVGMGVGFSVTVEAGFDAARKAVESAVGHRLTQCDTGDGMRTCGLELGPKRTITVMSSDDPASRQTLIGCYYYYEK